MTLFAAPALAIPAPPPANDNWADRTTLSGVDVSQAGTNLNATNEPSEPMVQGALQPNSVWYSWESQYGGTTVIDTCDSAGGDHFIAVFSGASLAELSLASSAGEGCTGATGPARVSFEATPGVTYSILVAAGDPISATDFSLSIGTGPLGMAIPDLSGAPFIGGQLALTTGTWIGQSPITFSYFWWRCTAGMASCMTLPETGSTYSPVAADLGFHILGGVMANNSVSQGSMNQALTAAVDYDTDGDGTGDATDTDDDGDGVPDDADACPLVNQTGPDGCAPVPPTPDPPITPAPPVISLLLNAPSNLGRIELKPRLRKFELAKVVASAVSSLGGSGNGASAAAYAATGRIVAKVKNRRTGKRSTVVLAQSSFTLHVGETRSPSFTLTRKGRALLARGRSVSATAELQFVSLADGSVRELKPRLAISTAPPAVKR